jgi:hypothetical protein
MKIGVLLIIALLCAPALGQTPETVRRFDWPRLGREPADGCVEQDGVRLCKPVSDPNQPPRFFLPPGMKARARLYLCVDPAGRVISADIATTSGSKDMDAAIAEAAKGGVYSPGTADGVPVTVCRVLESFRFGY